MDQEQCGRRFVPASLVLLCLLGTLPDVTQALYADEVGQYEWFLQQIGKPTALAFSGDSPDRIYAATSSGVVASMAMKDGKLKWRRVAAPDSKVRLLRTAGKGLASVTDNGLVQAWKGSNGDLTWQREYDHDVVDLLVAGKTPQQSVVVVGSAEVESRSLNGKLEWSKKLEDANRVNWAAATAETGSSSICLVNARADGSKAERQLLELATGKVLETASLPAGVSKGLSKGAFIVVDTTLVVLTDGTLTVYPFCADGSLEGFDLSKVKGSGTNSWELQAWQRTRGVFAASNGASTAIFGLGAKGLKHLRTLDGNAVVGPVFSVHDDETGQPVALATAKGEVTQIQLMDPASGNMQPAVDVTGFTASQHGQSELLLVHELSSGEHRTVISAADHSLAGIQAAKVNWVREEGLASIQQADFYSRHTQVGKPVSSEDQTLGTQLTALIGHAAEVLKAPLEIATYLTNVIMARKPRKEILLGMMPDAKIPTSSEELRDFGADKLILATTSAAKLYAIEATTSRIIWSKYLGPKSNACANDTPKNSSVLDGCFPWMQLLPSSASPHAELVVIAPAAISGSPPEVMWLDPVTGKLIHQETAPVADILTAMPLPLASKVGQSIHPLLFIDKNSGLHTLPKEAPELTESANNLFHFVVDSSEQVVQGFAVKPVEGSGRPTQMLNTWNMEFGSVGERILSAATPMHRQWDHVPVHIKGDSSILYKYINPNLLAVATEDSKGLNLYAIDAVTGQLVHQSHVQGGTSPVQLVQSDNWIIMHYRNAKKTRFEVTVIEFFHSKADEGPWDILFPGKQAARSRSAHHLDLPVPLQQTYIFPAGVTAMGVTATLKGITPRSIIMAMTTDQIARVSKDMLNPRRPYPTSTPLDKKSMPAQFAPAKDEILMPYMASMPVRPTDMLNYDKALGKVAGIVSSPTALESTSLVFTYGLDLFFTPVQTAKAYDVLSPGFNYLLLYGSVVVVLMVWVVVSVLASRKALQDRWK